MNKGKLTSLLAVGVISGASLAAMPLFNNSFYSGARATSSALEAVDSEYPDSQKYTYYRGIREEFIVNGATTYTSLLLRRPKKGGGLEEYIGINGNSKWVKFNEPFLKKRFLPTTPEKPRMILPFADSYKTFKVNRPPVPETFCESDYAMMSQEDFYMAKKILKQNLDNTEKFFIGNHPHYFFWKKGDFRFEVLFTTNDTPKNKHLNLSPPLLFEVPVFLMSRTLLPNPDKKLITKDLVRYGKLK